MKAETWYYTPCGRRMKQFPEIIKVDCAVDSLFDVYDLYSFAIAKVDV